MDVPCAVGAPRDRNLFPTRHSFALNNAKGHPPLLHPASEVFHGKRSISKTQAKKLAAFFHVSADLFI